VRKIFHVRMLFLKHVLICFSFICLAHFIIGNGLPTQFFGLSLSRDSKKHNKASNNTIEGGSLLVPRF
jgi:hypothetical protein